MGQLTLVDVNYFRCNRLRPFELPGSELILACAVLLPDQFEEEQVEDENEEPDREPEDGREAAELVPVAVKSDHVMLVCRG